MSKFRKIIVTVAPGGSQILIQRLVALRWPGSLLLLFIAAVLGSAASMAAAQCPAGSPTPYGLIGDTWQSYFVQSAIGCPIEPEHDVPGRRGRLQTFANGQIAWTPDQGPKMTIWAIRNKAHFRVQWDSNDPTWSYDKYLIRWDRNGKNMGQRDISGTRNGWWDFDFTDPGVYTFIVEGRSGGGYHHGWTIPVGGIVQPSDIPPPKVVPTPGPPTAANPRITVTYDAGKTLFIVNGSGFTPNHAVHVRVVNNANIQNPVTFQATSNGSGQLVNMPIQFPIAKPQTFSFSANDERQVPPRVDITGTLWSNTVTLTAS